MSIQKCKSCNYQFSWQEIQKAFRRTYKPLICRKCETSHLVSIQTRLLMVFLTGAILWILFSLTKSAPFVTGFTLFLLFELSMILLFPYYAKYKAI